MTLAVAWYTASLQEIVSVTVGSGALLLEQESSEDHSPRPPPRLGFLLTFEEDSFLERSLGKHWVTVSISREKTGIYPFRQLSRELIQRISWYFSKQNKQEKKKMEERILNCEHCRILFESWVGRGDTPVVREGEE